jgi:branched-chain amino acid transport system ATP-binding protein
MLELKEVHAFYGLAKVLSGIYLTVPEGHMVGLIGPNGAGKSTTLLSICGLHPIASGVILLNSKKIMQLAPQHIRKLGVATIPEGRGLFRKMTVIDNLLIGGHLCNDKKQLRETMAQVFSLFPILGNRRKQFAGTLSGGEQQMLAIGRALMANPKVILADEMSLGLAPLIIQEVYRVIKSINERGVSILLVEQQATIAFKFASSIYVMEQGKIAMEGNATRLAENEYIKKTYLGE